MDSEWGGASRTKTHVTEANGGRFRNRACVKPPPDKSKEIRNWTVRSGEFCVLENSH